MSKILYAATVNGFHVQVMLNNDGTADLFGFVGGAPVRISPFDNMVSALKLVKALAQVA